MLRGKRVPLFPAALLPGPFPSRMTSKVPPEKPGISLIDRLEKKSFAVPGYK
jgi:hypothetical protein